jgi:uncharacterized membrane protein YkgB
LLERIPIGAPPMTTATMTTPHSQRASLIAVLARVERHLLRYGLVLVIAWIACMKFTAYEANGIQPLVAHSPLLSWASRTLSA